MIAPFNFLKFLAIFKKKLSLISYLALLSGEESPSSLLVSFTSHQNTNGE